MTNDTLPWIGDTASDVGQTGGDAQASDAYGVRFHLPHTINGLYPVVDIVFFANDRWGKHGEALEDWEEPPKDIPATQRYTITQELNYGLCRQLELPWDHAEWETTTSRDAWFGLPTPPTSEQIKSIAQRAKPEWIFWDGTPMKNWTEWVQGVEPVEEENWEQLILPPELWKNVIEQQVFLSLRDEGGSTGAEYLAVVFGSEYCSECELDADAHWLVLDHNDNWSTVCKINTDPAFALAVALDNLEPGPVLPNSNVHPDAELREARFDAAIEALREDGYVDGELPPWKWMHLYEAGPSFRQQACSTIQAELGSAKELIERSKTDA